MCGTGQPDEARALKERHRVAAGGAPAAAPADLREVEYACSRCTFRNTVARRLAPGTDPQRSAAQPNEQ